MALVRYSPPPPLDAFVECFWWSERERAQTAPEQLLPTGAGSLVFSLHDVPITISPSSAPGESIRWTRGIVHGPQSTFYASSPKPPGASVGVAFRPGAAGAILGVPTAELADRHVPLDLLWSDGAGDLYERLCVAAAPSDMFASLEREFMARLARARLMHPAVAHAVAQRWRAGLRVSDIEREAGYSSRHFIALFRDAVGLTPRRYYRIKRFSGVLRALAATGTGDLAGVATTMGYADQSHLNREFREFAGLTPTQYRPRDATSPHHHSRHAR